MRKTHTDAGAPKAGTRALPRVLRKAKGRRPQAGRGRLPAYPAQLLLLVSYMFVPAFVPITAADVSDWPVW
eukprot:4197129-Prymnesium_polylepis.1